MCVLFVTVCIFVFFGVFFLFYIHTESILDHLADSVADVSVSICLWAEHTKFDL